MGTWKGREVGSEASLECCPERCVLWVRASGACVSACPSEGGGALAMNGVCFWGHLFVALPWRALVGFSFRCLVGGRFAAVLAGVYTS